MAPQAACVHEGGGVERRAAHHERERQRRRREAAGGSTEPTAEEATDVEAVSAADVLAGVEESGLSRAATEHTYHCGTSRPPWNITALDPEFTAELVQHCATITKVNRSSL